MRTGEARRSSRLACGRPQEKGLPPVDPELATGGILTVLVMVGPTSVGETPRAEDGLRLKGSSWVRPVRHSPNGCLEVVPSPERSPRYPSCVKSAGSRCGKSVAPSTRCSSPVRPRRCGARVPRPVVVTRKCRVSPGRDDLPRVGLRSRASAQPGRTAHRGRRRGARPDDRATQGAGKSGGPVRDCPA